MAEVNFWTWFVAGIKRRLLYSKTARRHSLVGPPAMWKMKRDFQRSFLVHAGLQLSHRLLDLGCGTLRGGISLIEYLEKGNYVGIEPREEALEKGRKELDDAGLAHKNPTLISGEPSTVDISRRFDVIWAFSVLFHMTDEIIDETLHFVQDHLADGGTFYANVKIGERPNKKWLEYPVSWRTHEAYRDACKSNGLSVDDLAPIGELGHESGDPEQDAQRMLQIRKQA